AMRGLPITLVHVVAPIVVSWPMGPMHDNITTWQREHGLEILDRSRRIAAGSTPDLRTELHHGAPVPGLVDASKDAEMVVVGSRGQSAFRRDLLGSVSSGLIRHGRCPVAVIHDADSLAQLKPKAPVLVGIDGSPASEAATALAFDEASRRGVDLVALHAWSDVAVFPILGMDWRTYRDQGEEALAERLAGWGERYPDVRVHRRLVCDRPARWLVEESVNAQLVVLGSHGRGGFAGMLLGSVSAAVAESTRVPVIVTRSG
ncbi:MAG TPA: universal stress protein, partial [Mycobacterium sp.]|nr:universal stress protein [Mycobacterium sp.]